MSAVEWLPRKEAAEMSGYDPAHISSLIREGLVPGKLGPRPAERPSIRKQVTYVHMPSLLAHQKENLSRVGARPALMLKSETKLGSQLQAWRVARGWSQRQVAAALNIAQNAVCEWELGRRVPSIRMVVRICELYDLDYKTRWSVIEAIAWKEDHRVHGEEAA